MILINTKNFNNYKILKSDVNSVAWFCKCKLEKKFKYKEGIIVQIKNLFMDCVDKIDGFQIIGHPKFDVAIIKLSGFSKISYKGHATFLKDDSNIKQGKSLCRLDYPFPEFSNFKYNKGKDDIEWTREGKKMTPIFPIDGIITSVSLL